MPISVRHDCLLLLYADDYTIIFTSKHSEVITD
jgi:hypothetical protein